MASMKKTTLKVADLNVQNFKFSAYRKTTNAKGTDNVFLNYNSQYEGVEVQFPLLRVPFPLGDRNEDGSITIALALDNDNPKGVAAIDKLREFDARILEEIRANAKPWLNKNPHLLDERWQLTNFSPFLKVKMDEEGENEKYFTIKVKLPAKDGQIKTEVTDGFSKGENGTYAVVDPFETIVPRCQVQVIARPSRIWFQKTGKCGTTWEASYLRVYAADGNQPQGADPFQPEDEEEQPQTQETAPDSGDQQEVAEPEAEPVSDVAHAAEASDEVETGAAEDTGKEETNSHHVADEEMTAAESEHEGVTITPVKAVARGRKAAAARKA